MQYVLIIKGSEINERLTLDENPTGYLAELEQDDSGHIVKVHGLGCCGQAGQANLYYARLDVKICKKILSHYKKSEKENATIDMEVRDALQN